jgi:prephenate dehydratase
MAAGMAIVAVQGVAGCFSQQAAAKLAPNAALLYCREMPDAFRAVQEGRAAGLVLPVWNTLAGEITPHLALAEAHPQLVKSLETSVHVRMCLLGVPGAKVANVRRVYSHPVALRQCGNFFAQHPAIRPEAFHDTAAAVKHVMEVGDPACAAMASSAAGEEYGATTLAADCQDEAENFTQFWLLRAVADTGRPQA